MYWWTSLVRDVRIYNNPQIWYWNELRVALRKKHTPSYYDRELIDKLHGLQLTYMSIEEYR